jgi:hypothetical protein
MSLPVKHLPRNYVPFVDVTDAPKSSRGRSAAESEKTVVCCTFAKTYEIRELGRGPLMRSAKWRPRPIQLTRSAFCHT